MKKTIVLGCSLVLMAGSASAAIMGDTSQNDRSPQIDIDGTSLQDLFDSNVLLNNTTSYLQAEGDQDSAANWFNSDGASSAYMISLISTTTGKLGVYSTSSGEEYMFDMGTLGPFASIQYFSSTGQLKISDEGGATFLNSVGNFGFFFDTDGLESTLGDRVYTQDSQNSGSAQALSYKVGANTTTTIVDGTATTGTNDNDDWIIAFEDSVNGTKNFTDGVFYIKDMAVSAPATLALMGLGLLGLAYSKRRKSA